MGISAKVLAQDQKVPSQEERTKAVNVVRLVNTAEYNQGHKTETDSIEPHGRHTSWETPICSFQPTENRTPLRYMITKNGDGLFSVFSDQSGIIFLGSPLQ